ncbi:hypothetical protein HID58_025327 [Brassica napus]|uniref:Uncharacterized protein n=1 Tax=Brassica napus TaxID=3708 RepID=A0ABQ8CKS2_BRANA|nr:hypothetical protein HID58_025327 [Brassica napus]
MDTECIILSLIIYPRLIPLLKYIFDVCKANDINGRHAEVNTIPNKHPLARRWLEKSPSSKNFIIILVIVVTCMVLGYGFLAPSITGTSITYHLLRDDARSDIAAHCYPQTGSPVCILHSCCSRSNMEPHHLGSSPAWNLKPSTLLYTAAPPPPTISYRISPNAGASPLRLPVNSGSHLVTRTGHGQIWYFLGLAHYLISWTWTSIFESVPSTTLCVVLLRQPLCISQQYEIQASSEMVFNCFQNLLVGFFNNVDFRIISEDFLWISSRFIHLYLPLCFSYANLSAFAYS